MNPSLKAIVERCERDMNDHNLNWTMTCQRLMPVIRALCAELSNYIGEDQCYCTGDTNFNGPGQECKPCKTTKRLEQLGLGEGK